METDAGAGARLPRIASAEPIPSGVRLQLEVPAGLAWFAGHFPGDPLVPGVAQVGWAVAFARERFGFGCDPAAYDQVKFQRPIRPGAVLELELVREAERPGRVLWRLSEGGETAGSGRMDFGAA